MKKTAVKPPKKEFKCNYCHKNMASKASLKNHVLKQHEQKAVCDVVKDNPQPSTSKTFKCENCDQTFSSKVSVKKHNETIHDRKNCTVYDVSKVSS